MARRAQVKVTTDHEEIRRWAEERGAIPARVHGTEGSDDVGIIRLAFPGAPNAKDEKLEPISWDEWFREFDERGLALVYEETTATGQKSNFNKIISRETAEARQEGDTKASRRSARGTSTRKRAAAAATGAAASRRKSATSSSRQSSSGTRAASSRKKTTKAASGTRSAGRKSQTRATASTSKRSSSRKTASSKSAGNVRSISSGRGSSRADRTASARGREGGRSNRRAA